MEPTAARLPRPARPLGSCLPLEAHFVEIKVDIFFTCCKKNSSGTTIKKVRSKRKYVPFPITQHNSLFYFSMFHSSSYSHTYTFFMRFQEHIDTTYICFSFTYYSLRALLIYYRDFIITVFNSYRITHQVTTLTILRLLGT